MFLVKSEKVRIATRQDTVNRKLYEVEGTYGRAYVTWIADMTTSDGDACPIVIFLLRSDLTRNHGVENLFLLS